MEREESNYLQMTQSSGLNRQTSLLQAIFPFIRDVNLISGGSLRMGCFIVELTEIMRIKRRTKQNSVGQSSRSLILAALSTTTRDINRTQKIPSRKSPTYLVSAHVCLCFSLEWQIYTNLIILVCFWPFALIFWRGQAPYILQNLFC